MGTAPGQPRHQLRLSSFRHLAWTCEQAAWLSGPSVAFRRYLASSFEGPAARRLRGQGGLEDASLLLSSKLPLPKLNVYYYMLSCKRKRMTHTQFSSTEADAARNPMSVPGMTIMNTDVSLYPRESTSL